MRTSRVLRVAATDPTISSISVGEISRARRKVNLSIPVAGFEEMALADKEISKTLANCSSVFTRMNFNDGAYREILEGQVRKSLNDVIKRGTKLDRWDIPSVGAAVFMASPTLVIALPIIFSGGLTKSDIEWLALVDFFATGACYFGSVLCQYIDREEKYANALRGYRAYDALLNRMTSSSNAK